jgi:PAS domain S-box-containing protein
MTSENNLADILFLVNTHYEIVSYYAINKDLLFTSPEHFLEKKFTKVLPENEAALFQAMTDKVIAEKKSAKIEYELPLADGIHHFVSEYAPAFSTNDEVKQVLVLVKDVTWEYNREKILFETQERFRSIFETARSGIVFGNMHLHILECNKAFCELMEDDAENLKKKSLIDFTHPEDIQKEKVLLDNLLAGKINECRISKRCITQKNQVKWIDLSVSVIRDKSNVPLFFVGIANDISEAVKTRTELNQINLAKDKLFSIIGHDLRTPLSSISTLITLLKRSNDNDPDFVKQALDMIDECSHNAIGLLTNLLDWAKTQTNLLEAQLQEADISEIVTRSVELLKHNIDAKKITMDMTNMLRVTAYIDPNMIYTVVRNLISNAIKFTYPGGKITCITGQTDSECWIEIRDNGVGMDEGKLGGLFNVSTQQSAAGTLNEPGGGLGLLICREFVQKHNGHIEVNSEVNKGSSFKILLPLKN